MGNKLGNDHDQFQKMIKSMKSKQNQSAGSQTKITINPEQKYLSVMIEKLSMSNLPEELKNKLSLTLHQKISKQQLIKTVSIANVLKNNQFDIEPNRNTIINSVKKNYLTNNVKLNIDLNKINPYIKRNLILKSNLKIPDIQNIADSEVNHDEIIKIQEDKQIKQSNSKTNCELAFKILKQQMKKIYHPFWKLNKAFADYVTHEFATNLSAEQLKLHQDPQRYEGLIRKLLSLWCSYLQQGCFYPYKKWLIQFIEISESKLSKALQQMLLQQIFLINNSYLFHGIMLIISQHRVPLKINLSLLNQQKDFITPQIFLINQKLQIEGNFFISNFECSHLEGMIEKPEKILKQLELLKNCICKDIDEYHKLTEKQQFYQIDSDNILGIVNFILTRIPSQIDAIYKLIIFLRIVYGDAVYHAYGIASYMLSTLSGSMEFLQSEQFFKLLKQNPLNNKKPISPPTKPPSPRDPIKLKESSDKQIRQNINSTTTEDSNLIKQSISSIKQASSQSRQQKIKQYFQSTQKSKSSQKVL